MLIKKQNGVPQFECTEFAPKKTKYVLLIPVINVNKKLIKIIIKRNLSVLQGVIFQNRLIL